jgi:hypothetical protein
MTRALLLVLSTVVLHGCGALVYVHQALQPDAGVADAGMADDGGSEGEGEGEGEGESPNDAGIVVTQTLRAWLRADSPLVLLDGAGLVDRWSSQVGTFAVAQQVAVAKPGFETDAQGRASLRFDGAQHLFPSNGPLPLRASTVFLVFERVPSGNADMIPLAWAVGAFHNRLQLDGDFGVIKLRGVAEDENRDPFTTFDRLVGDLGDLSGWHALAVTVDDGQLGVWVDDRLPTFQTFPDNTAETDGYEWILGNVGANVGQNGMRGGISEILIYEERLSNGLIEQTLANLRARYDL